MFQLIIVCKTASSHCIFQEAKEIQVAQCQIRTVGRMRENSHHIWHPPCTDFSLANFSDDGHNRQFSNPCHGALFNSRDTEVIPNRRINLVFGHYHYCGWLATAGPVTNVSSLLSKQQTQHLTEPTFMASSPHMLLRSL